MAERTVKSYEPKTKSKSKETAAFTATVAVEFEEKELKSVTPRLKKEILKRDQCCQFKDPKTGKICGSKYFLEIDHIQPRFLDGPHISDNLRVLCKNHNGFRYSAGI